MSDPSSIEDWLRLVAQHERAANLLCEDKHAAQQGAFHVGLAVECALKAYIIRTERLNAWPSRDARPELYTHDLRELFRIAGLAFRPSDPVAPSWHVMLQWDRRQGYDPRPMPRKVARSMFEAAFSQRGAVTWIRLSLKQNT